MAKLTPYFFSEDARSQADFYVSALGGEINSIMTFGETPNCPDAMKDKVMHLCMTVAGVTFFMSDSVQGPLQQGNNLDLNLEYATVEEARAAFDRLSAGGKVVAPLKKEFWGSWFSKLEDKYGIGWMITTAGE
ncbi:VOC family protein [Paenibacillus sp. GD4]|jgi:PhnB protein|uniref:VOC family protein n=1 Tax=Paenibacillus sp. GD4 TaxID=3068890 RepID=UPI00279654E5|nr:VOC family protein [Paenibacillus sp. GD4]MDQ1911482.1 VOC family protein [Paenibacillus sp. GD4]